MSSEEFNDKEIEKSMTALKIISENRKNHLDKISNDIKNVERFLQSSALSSFCFSYGENSLDPDITLYWDEKRLLVKFVNETVNFEKKPIVESKVAIRMICAKYLSEFLDDLCRSQIMEKMNENN